MVYTSYAPTSLQDSITSICKTILPFPSKKRRIPAIEQRLSDEQSDNLKWQQNSFHQMLNLMGLCKEGIVSRNEVSAFRIHLLETLIASPVDHEPPLILRDKLIFLQVSISHFSSNVVICDFTAAISAFSSKKKEFLVSHFTIVELSLFKAYLKLVLIRMVSLVRNYCMQNAYPMKSTTHRRGRCCRGSQFKELRSM